MKTECIKSCEQKEIEEFTRELLEELKDCINCTIAERRKFEYIDTDESRLKYNRDRLEKDQKLLEIVTNKLDERRK